VPSYGSSSSRSGHPGVPSHDLLLDDPLERLGWSAPEIDDDEMPWQAGALVAADDVEIFGRPPRWRRIGPRGVAAVIGAVLVAALAGLQVTGNLPGGGGDEAAPATTTLAAPTTSVVPTTATTTVPTTATTAAPTTVAPTTQSTRPATVQPPTTAPRAAPTAAAAPAATTAAPPSPSTAAPASLPASSTSQPPAATTPPTQAPLPPVAGPVAGQSENRQPAAAAPANDTAAPATDAGTPATGGNTEPAASGAIDPGTGQPIRATANTNVGASTTNNSSTPADVFEPLRNKQAKFSQFADVPSDQLDFGALTMATDRADNGPQSVEGQFRVLCEYSHISYDDPIVFPGQPGRSHLHMFFGNTNTNAFTTTESLVNSGGGTCNGFELNRSAYWFPAMLKGEEAVIAPHSIVVYYKTKNPGNAVALPQGLKLVAGNPRAETFQPSPALHWSCGPSGAEYNITNRIPDCGTDFVNAVLQFANCWDGVNLDSPDHASHVAYALDDLGTCPASHPKPIPQISILLYWQGTGSVDGWHLSSDNYNGFNAAPGSTLHADWFGGWNEQAMQTWMNGCIKAVRNCSGGQTGTDRILTPINGMQNFEGDPVLPLPRGSYQMG